MTDKIAIERETLERAVTALVYHLQQTRPVERTQIAIRELRTLLAQQAEPQEPIGEVIISTDPLGREGMQVVKWAENAPPTLVGMKLYAAPPAPAAVPPEPLTYAEIMSIAYDCNALPEVITDASMRVFVRAIEHAHGIGDKP